jgi:predicted helicase
LLFVQSTSWTSTCFIEGAIVNFPLYLYPSAESSGVFEEERRPNLAEWLLPKLSTAYGFTPEPEEVLAYIYAVLYSPTYRRAYAEALRSDFPRIPFVADGEVFRRMAELGQRLIDLHLLRSKDLDPPRVRFEGEGDGQIQVVRYEPSSQRVYISRSQYFEPVPLEVWEYQIGGYQVLEKYLKDRKGRRLEDPVHYLTGGDGDKLDVGGSGGDRGGVWGGG